MHLWMHIGAQIILTQLGSTSPCQPMCACACAWLPAASTVLILKAAITFGLHHFTTVVRKTSNTCSQLQSHIRPHIRAYNHTLTHKHSFSDMRYYDCISSLFWAACYDVPHRILGDYGGGTLDPQGSVQGFAQKKYILKGKCIHLVHFECHFERLWRTLWINCSQEHKNIGYIRYELYMNCDYKTKTEHRAELYVVSQGVNVQKEIWKKM